MIRFVAVILLAVLPLAAVAQPVRVSTGEHDGFTRLVLDYGTPVDWQVGRTLDGYELRLANARPSYDLTEVYDPIGRRRLASVWVDPDGGALRIGIGCACHAQPFEFRPGIVVIDLKDGPPPSGSTFEVALNGEAMPGLSPRPPRRPRARPARFEGPPPATQIPARYDWTALVLDPGSAPSAAPVLPAADPALQPLREVLLQQLSRGVAQGVVEMARPTSPGPAEPGQTAPEAGGLQVRLDQQPGLRFGASDGLPKGLTAQGSNCVADDLLDLGSWGDDRSVAEQMAKAAAGLIGEFDTPDPVAEQRAVRFLLFLGFGAEARQVLTQMSGGQTDAPVLTSLAHLLDGTADPTPAFGGMAACGTAAALWAVLGDPSLERGSAFDRAAVLRSFSALPTHLRRWLGLRLTDRLLALGDPGAAQTVRDAILRAPGEAGPAVAVMEARLDLAAGDPAAAEARLEPLIADPGPATADALVAQVDTHLARRAALDPGVITALEGLLHERADSTDAARFTLALTRARALSGDFEGAFADLERTPEAAQDIWALLAETGPDSSLLSHAIRPEGMTPTVSMPVATALARRLSDLGFAEQAQGWLRQVPSAEATLSARIALQTGDARTALRLVAGSADPALVSLRQEALRQLQAEAELAESLAVAGEEKARWQAIGRARDWSQLAASGPALWKTLAAAAVGTEALDPGTGPLARGQILIDSSARTRAAVAGLLAEVPKPIPLDP